MVEKNSFFRGVLKSQGWRWVSLGFTQPTKTWAFSGNDLVYFGEVIVVLGLSFCYGVSGRSPQGFRTLGNRLEESPRDPRLEIIEYAAKDAAAHAVNHAAKPIPTTGQTTANHSPSHSPSHSANPERGTP